MRRIAFVFGASSLLALVACGNSQSEKPTHSEGGHAATSTSGNGGRSNGGSAGSAGTSALGGAGVAGSRGGSSAGVAVAGAGVAGNAGGVASAGGGAGGGAGGIGAARGGSGGQAGAEAGNSGSDDAGAAGAAGEPENPAGGSITIAALHESDATFFTQTTAGFWAPSAPTPGTCLYDPAGDCTIVTCPSTSSSAAAPAAAKSPDAGAISLTCSAESYDKTLSPDGNGAYATDADRSVTFQAGDVVSIHATGDEVPAFTTTMTAPTPLVIDTTNFPARDQNHMIPVNPKQDLVLTFQHGKPGVNVQVDGYGVAGNPTFTSVSCLVDSSRGTLTIPARALTSLSSLGFVDFITVGTTSVTVGDYPVTLLFGMDVNDQDGVPVAFSMTGG
jgi:hypothetical protein